MMVDEVNDKVLPLTAQIVAAHVSHNQVAVNAMPALIESVYQSLSAAGAVETKPEALTPAVPWKKSVFPEYIICLEDGKKLKMLKRYLNVRYGMTPGQYRAKWALPGDYPMVAPSYTSKRSRMAKAAGLGRKGETNKPEEPVAPRAKKAKG